MNLLADEGVDRQIVVRLRQTGHKVFYIAEMDCGVTDDIVLEQANQHGALLVTADKDFGELVFRLGRLNNGVILLRLAGLSPEKKADVVMSVLRDHAAQMQCAFSVISPGAVRIRPSDVSSSTA
jgi:predicted nuclease of predicted toxin-antitoxin system